MTSWAAEKLMCVCVCFVGWWWFGVGWVSACLSNFIKKKVWGQKVFPELPWETFLLKAYFQRASCCSPNVCVMDRPYTCSCNVCVCVCVCVRRLCSNLKAIHIWRVCVLCVCVLYAFQNLSGSRYIWKVSVHMMYVCVCVCVCVARGA